MTVSDLPLFTYTTLSLSVHTQFIFLQVQLDPHFPYAQLLYSLLQFGEVHDGVTSSLIMMDYDMKNSTCIPTPMYSATKVSK